MEAAGLATRGCVIGCVSLLLMFKRTSRVTALTGKAMASLFIVSTSILPVWSRYPGPVPHCVAHSLTRACCARTAVVGIQRFADDWDAWSLMGLRDAPPEITAALSARALIRLSDFFCGPIRFGVVYSLRYPLRSFTVANFNALF